MRLIVLISFVCSFFVMACSKGGTNNPDPDGGGGVTGPIDYDTIAPGITITTPTSGQTLQSGTTYNITGTITDDYGLYQGFVQVTNDANSLEIKKQNYEIHGFLRYNFTVPFTPSVTTNSDYTVTVSFEDHGNNRTTKTVKVRIAP